MIHARTTTIGLTLLALAAPLASAQNSRVYEEDGIKYQETVHETQRPLNSTRYESRESVVQRPRYTTNMQPSVRTYQVPVTEEQWVLGYQRTWNVFKPPVPSYRLMKVTRWETRSETINVPITKLEYVPERVVQQVPITDTKIAKETITRRVAIGVTEGAPAVARRDDFGPSSSIGGSSSTSTFGEPPAASSFGGQVDRRK